MFKKTRTRTIFGAENSGGSRHPLGVSRGSKKNPTRSLPFEAFRMVWGVLSPVWPSVIFGHP